MILFVILDAIQGTNEALCEAYIEVRRMENVIK